MTTEFSITGVRIPKTHLAKLDQIATSKHTSRNTVILWALDEYLGRISLPDGLPEKTGGHEESQPEAA